MNYDIRLQIFQITKSTNNLINPFSMTRIFVFLVSAEAITTYKVLETLQNNQNENFRLLTRIFRLLTRIFKFPIQISGY